MKEKEEGGGESKVNKEKKEEGEGGALSSPSASCLLSLSLYICNLMYTNFILEPYK